MDCRRAQPERKATKRGREEDDVAPAAAPAPPWDAEVEFPFDASAAAAAVDDVIIGDQLASRRPPPPAGVFRFPWQSCRGGLGVAASGGGGGGGGWELRDVFFRSLVDGGAAAIGVPGDRLVSPPRALFDGVDAWLAAAAGDGQEVDPVWRSALVVIEGEPPAPAA